MFHIAAIDCHGILQRFWKSVILIPSQCWKIMLENITEEILIGQSKNWNDFQWFFSDEHKILRTSKWWASWGKYWRSCRFLVLYFSSSCLWLERLRLLGPPILARSHSHAAHFHTEKWSSSTLLLLRRCCCRHRGARRETCPWQSAMNLPFTSCSRVSSNAFHNLLPFK